MIKIQTLKFAEAKRTQLEEILTIHNANVRGSDVSNQAGFLLAKTSEAEILNNLNHSTQYFVAADPQDRVLGFLAVGKPKISEDFLNQIHWHDRSYQEKITSDRHLYIKIVATKPEYMGQGIAQFLYQSLYDTFPHSWLSVFIVTKPISNDRSIRFHEKQGFQPIGTWQCDRLLDLENYESLLMFKAL